MQPKHKRLHGPIAARRQLVAAAAIFWLTPPPLFVVAAPRLLKIGRLSEGRARADLVELLRDSLRELGHPEVAIEIRDADGKLDRLPALAAELVELIVDIICAHGSGATEAAKNATSTTPIAMVSLDAVEAGLVSNLAPRRKHHRRDSGRLGSRQEAARTTDADGAECQAIDRRGARDTRHARGRHSGRRRLDPPFEDINRFANTAKSSAEKILERARITQEGLSAQIEAIVGEFVKLKEDASD